MFVIFNLVPTKLQYFCSPNCSKIDVVEIVDISSFISMRNSGCKIHHTMHILCISYKFADIFVKMLNIFDISGTYFNCIMFMVASSVVTTIMILNYHHRQADTHQMPPWVRWWQLTLHYTGCFWSFCHNLNIKSPIEILKHVLGLGHH